MSLQTQQLGFSVIIVITGIIIPCAYIIFRGGRTLDKEQAVRNAASDDTWCQFCDEIKLTTDFKVDPIGRWACTQCRIDAGFEDEKQEEPARSTLQPTTHCKMCNIGITPSIYIHHCRECAHQAKETQNQWNKQKTEEDVKQHILKSQRYEGRNITLGDVPAKSKVDASGNGCSVHVDGNVGEGATITSIGNGAEIRILGRVGDGVLIRASGNAASIHINDDIGKNGTIHASGNGAEVRHRSTHPSTQVAATGNGARVIESRTKKVC